MHRHLNTCAHHLHLPSHKKEGTNEGRKGKRKSKTNKQNKTAPVLCGSPQLFCLKMPVAQWSPRKRLCCITKRIDVTVKGGCSGHILSLSWTRRMVAFSLLTRDVSCVFSGDRLYSICLFPPVRELQVEPLSLTSHMYPLAAHNSPESW